MIKLSGYWQDLLERAVRTFIPTYYGAWTVASLPSLTPTYDAMFRLASLQTAFAASVASVAISLGAKRIGNRNSASVLSGVSAPTKPVKPVKKPK